MNKIRAEATYVLSSLSIIYLFQPFIANNNVDIPIHTSCKRLINQITTNHINRPSNALADHISIIYQIRSILQEIQFNISFIHTQAPKEDDLEKTPEPEQLIHKIHKLTLSDYQTSDCQIPCQHPILFPAQTFSSSCCK